MTQRLQSSSSVEQEEKPDHTYHNHHGIESRHLRKESMHSQELGKGKVTAVQDHGAEKEKGTSKL